MRDIVIAITAASYSGNKGAAAMLQSSIRQLHDRYGERLNIHLMSVYPSEDRKQIPWDFIKIVPCKPEQLLFVAFPLAVLYKLFSWCPPVKKLLLKNKILKAYSQTDAVLDEAGISFVDSRGFVMNTYAFVCAAVPMLVGTPVMKYSQAMGTFHSFTNRFLAKWILPKMKLICARGEGTLENLRSIGVEENVRLCADGAFTMADDERCNAMVEEVCGQDAFYRDAERLVGLSISSVVEKKCKKLGIDYKGIMITFIERLNQAGYKVLIIANGARIGSQKPRNNDLMICDAVYEGVKDKELVRWYHREMEAEEIRAYIGKCRFLVASRFHAMIGALEKKVPVLLVGWSHKYQEVLDFFKLGQYAIDFSNLTADSLEQEFQKFVKCEDEIRGKIEENYDAVMESSRKNILYVSEVIDEIMEKPYKKKKILDYRNPDKYLGEHAACRKGYAADESIRENAASGGMVTALLCHLLKTGQIDGAWVTKTEIRDGKLGYHTFIAVTEEEIRSASSSIYMNIPLLKHVDLVRNFDGRVAVVMTPCMLQGLTKLMEKEEELKKKIVLKLGLYCSGNHSEKATLLSLEQSKVSLTGAKRLYYRRGHWRGLSSVVYEDGSEKTFSYTKTICAYKNAYFFEKGSCMTCQDHFASAADISFGDIWLKEMKGNPIKHTSCVIRNERALAMYRQAVEAGAIVDSHISGRDMVRSQKRALVFKYTCAPAKLKYFAKQGKTINLTADDTCRWNHRLAFTLAEKNKRYSEEHYESLRKIPYILIYYYMCLIRVLLSF
jgi:coenzyme F420-reducing hydrogenase beta subunit/polysaccharide pyruvyl transferase WcaK-like protein